MLARHKNTVPLSSSTKLTFITLLFLCLPVVLTQLALECQTATQLELSSILKPETIALNSLGRQPDPSST